MSGIKKFSIRRKIEIVNSLKFIDGDTIRNDLLNEVRYKLVHKLSKITDKEEMNEIIENVFNSYAIDRTKFITNVQLKLKYKESKI